MPLPVREEMVFSVAAQLGGIFNAVGIEEHTIYLGIGLRFATVDIGDLAAPRLLWQIDVLPDVVGAIALLPGLAFLRVGAELLIYDTSDPTLPARVGTIRGISGKLFPIGDFVYAIAAGVFGVANQPLIATDVTDPGQPTLARTRQLSSEGPRCSSQNSWRRRGCR